MNKRTVMLVAMILLVCAVAGILLIDLLGGKDKLPEQKKLAEEGIKLAVITGRTDTVPPEIGLTKHQIIKAYLFDCYNTKDINKRVSCYEEYYLNQDKELMLRKSQCESEQCLDQFYFDIAPLTTAQFCHGIRSEVTKAQCFERIS